MRPYSLRGKTRSTAAIMAGALALSLAWPVTAASAAPSEHPNPPTVSQPIGGAALAGKDAAKPAGSPKLPDGINASSWLLADADTGEVLAARDAHKKYLPASTLKTLTALTLLPTLTDRKKTVTVNKDVTEVDGTRVGLVNKGKYQVETLFQCMLMMSGNDCATALAESAGGVPKALEMMNAEARRLQALDTHAATPSGLDGPDQASSAYDLGLILRADLKLPDFLKYNTMRSSKVPPQPPKYGGYQFNNDNLLLRNYPGTIAAKNGYTDAARHTFVAAAQNGKRRLIVTLMHGERAPVDMWKQAASLLDWGFSLPSNTPGVGRLVEPQPVVSGDQKPATQATSPAVNSAKPVAQKKSSQWTVPALIGGSVIGLGAVVAMVRRRRRRPPPAHARSR